MFEISDGVVYVDLSPEETTILAQLPALIMSADADARDRGYAVLHRPVYDADPVAELELLELVGEEVGRQRTADRLVLEGIGEGGKSMTTDAAHGFLRCLNEARLVLAARSGAFEEDDGWEDRISSDPVLAAVAWLGYVQAELIGQLTRDQGHRTWGV